MAKIFSFASWNVEHFTGKPDRADRIVSLLTEKNPDVFAIYEVEGKDVFTPLLEKLPDHSFTLTEHTIQRNMEILIGVRRSMQFFVTQREEFQSTVPTLRPGALVTLRINGAYYSLLFLHTKSADDARSWGLRTDMFRRTASLKRTLDDVTAPDPANFICLGDLNTMGLTATYNDISDLTADQEIESLERRMSAVNMRRLGKTHEASWWNGSPNYSPSRLDHVFAAEHLQFKQTNGSEVEVFGWPEKATENEKKDWIENFSDHALLYAEVHD